jgi:hypothetical protein
VSARARKPAPPAPLDEPFVRSWWEELSVLEQERCSERLKGILQRIAVPRAVHRSPVPFAPWDPIIDFALDSDGTYGYPAWPQARLNPHTTHFDPQASEICRLPDFMTQRMRDHHEILRLTGRLLVPTVGIDGGARGSCCTDEDGIPPLTPQEEIQWLSRYGFEKRTLPPLPEPAVEATALGEFD